MSVATVTEISATSQQGFEDAVQQGIQRANKTLRNIEGAWVKDQNVMIEDGNITGYKVNLEVTFVLEDTAEEEECEPRRRNKDALQADHAAAGQREGQRSQARPADLQRGFQLCRGAVRRGGPRPPRGVERRRREVREEREGQLGPEGQLTHPRKTGTAGVPYTGTPVLLRTLFTRVRGRGILRSSQARRSKKLR